MFRPWRDYETVLIGRGPRNTKSAAEHAEYAERPGGALLARLIPSSDRESIRDLIEDAGFRDLAGARRNLWLTGECAAIAGGLSIQRARSWVVVPPVREVAAGLALDGRGVFRSTGAAGSLLRAVLFCGSVATLALGVEVLVSSLLAASGY